MLTIAAIKFDRKWNYVSRQWDKPTPNHSFGLGHLRMISPGSSTQWLRQTAATGRSNAVPDSKIHGVNMGPIWVLSAPDGPHVDPMNFAVRGCSYPNDSICWIRQPTAPPCFHREDRLGSDNSSLTLLSNPLKQPPSWKPCYVKM